MDFHAPWFMTPDLAKKRGVEQLNAWHERHDAGKPYSRIQYQYKDRRRSTEIACVVIGF